MTGVAVGGTGVGVGGIGVGVGGTGVGLDVAVGGTEVAVGGISSCGVSVALSVSAGWVVSSVISPIIGN